MISGHTQILAHIGVPTATFTAPLIYNPWFEAKGIDAVVVPMGCEAADYPAFLPLVFRLTNIAGALITMPHKVATVGLLDEASMAVEICGACNAVRRAPDGKLQGAMFDGEGFVRGMRSKGRGIAGASAIVAGCGGVGSAIAASLAEAGIASLALFDPATGAMEGLAERLRRHYPALEIRTGARDPAGRDIVVNATPLGMKAGDPLPFETDRIDPSAFIGEVVLTKQETPFLAAARARGCKTQLGIDMLFEQIPAYLEFFGYPAATADELRRLARLD